MFLVANVVLAAVEWFGVPMGSKDSFLGDTGLDAPSSEEILRVASTTVSSATVDESEEGISAAMAGLCSTAQHSTAQWDCRREVGGVEEDEEEGRSRTIKDKWTSTGTGTGTVSALGTGTVFGGEKTGVGR